MPDYSQTRIYKLACKDTSILDEYVGHTTNYDRRRKHHKDNVLYESKRTCNVHHFIRDNGGWENWEMILIEDFPCGNKREAEHREREIIEELKPTLNLIRPYVTKEEEKKQARKRSLSLYHQNYKHNEEYKRKKKEYLTEYSKTNKIKIALQKKELKECPHCQKMISSRNLARHIKSFHNASD